MLRSLTLTNFRRHRAATFNFGPGHNVIRGVNEAGKTTLAEALAYALFGSKALRDPFADVVTWDEKDSSLKVTAELVIGPQTFTFVRGKSGAECRYGDKLVTGQDEVSAFAGNLLGTDYKLAPKLMLASQNGLRGALEEGPSKTGDMIEKLADFDLFDRLVDAMTNELALGPAAPFEQRVREAQERLDALPELPAVDGDQVRQKIEEAREAAASAAAAVERLKPAAAAAKTALDLASASASRKADAIAALASARSSWGRHHDELVIARDRATTGPGTAAIEAARVAVADAEKIEERLAAHGAITKLMASYPEQFWDEPQADLDEAVAQARQTTDEASASEARARQEVAVQQASRITGSVCGFCGQDTSQFPEVAAKNASIDLAIGNAKALVAEYSSCRLRNQGYLDAYLSIVQAAKPYQQAGLRYAAFVDVDESVVPPCLTWKGEVPDGGTDKRTAAQRLSSLEESQRAAERAEANVAFLTRAVGEDERTVADRQAALDALPPTQDLGELTAAASRTADEVRTQEAWVREYEARVSRLAVEEAESRAAVELRQQQRNLLASQLSEQKKQLEELGFNNALLAKIRKARPIIADKLWNTVLASVSTMFTQMRGEPSIVSKDKAGFKVNGKASSLSGSTLDLLGLAIRVALIKTFVPHCPFLLVDEPFAACDDERTAKMLGFITAAGFTQTVIITHEDMSESVSDNLVTL